MALVGAIIGLPMFFEIGLVLLMPVIYLVARRSQLSLITIGIPALAGLSAMHGLVPPHPGPLIAIDCLGANLGITLALGVLVAMPTVDRRGPAVRQARRPLGERRRRRTPFDADRVRRRTPSSGARRSRVTMFSVLLPVVLMLGKALVDIFIDDESQLFRQIFDVLGTPLIALLIAVIVGMFTLGRGAGMDRDADHQVRRVRRCPPIAGILLIVAAGGGFKQVLVDTGIGTLLADWARAPTSRSCCWPGCSRC